MDHADQSFGRIFRRVCSARILEAASEVLNTSASGAATLRDKTLVGADQLIGPVTAPTASMIADSPTVEATIASFLPRFMTSPCSLVGAGTP